MSNQNGAADRPILSPEELEQLRTFLTVMDAVPPADEPDRGPRESEALKNLSNETIISTMRLFERLGFITLGRRKSGGDDYDACHIWRRTPDAEEAIPQWTYHVRRAEEEMRKKGT